MIRERIAKGGLLRLSEGYAFRFFWRVGDRRSAKARYYKLEAGCLYYCEFVNTKKWVGLVIKRIMAVTEKGIYVK